jgi:Tfp pilus assembly protein PilO
MTATNKTIVAILVVVALAIAFWMLLLAPKREEADDLGKQSEQLQTTLLQSQSEVVEAEAARREFPRNYQQLVVLGKAVPANDESSSLLIELNHIADDAGVKFESLKVGTTNGSEAGGEASEAAPAPAAPAPTEGAVGTPAAAVAPTEAAASLLPIGAQVGPAGLGVLPYDLTFKGNFFHVADFIQGLDSLVHTGGTNVAVDGRLVTLDGFSLSGNAKEGFPQLNANFSVTTYLVPPGQGVTAGATPTAPTEVEAIPTANASNAG